MKQGQWQCSCVATALFRQDGWTEKRGENGEWEQEGAGRKDKTREGKWGLEWGYVWSNLWIEIEW